MTGYGSEEAIGRNPRILKSERQAPNFYKDLWDTITSGLDWHGELINRRKDGSIYSEEMRITPVRDSQREIVSYIAIKRDVTERRVAEEAKRFLASIVECSEDAIIANSPAGIVLTWNRGAEALLGYSAEEIIGRHVSMLIAPELHHRIAPFLELVLKSRASARREDQLIRKDGRRVSVSVTANCIPNFAGEAVAVSAVIRDITEQEKAEESRALLASIVESSADAIVSETLDGTIVSWNKSADTLFGYTASEIVGKNYSVLEPPAGRGEVRQAIEDVRGGAVRHYDTVRIRKDGRPIDVLVTVSPVRNSQGKIVRAAVNASGRTLLALIDDVLDLSKIEAQKITLEHVDFDLRRTAEDVFQTLRSHAAAKGLAFRWEAMPEIPLSLRGDPHRLRQVLLNLAGNAIKFTEQGEVVLRAVIDNQGGGKATLRFAVTDTGIGIRPDQAAAVFSPFVQADASTTRKYGGTGLGLSISKHLVEMMGGTIGVDREGDGPML